MNYFDLHCDTITKCFEKHCGLAENGLNVSLKKVERYENWAQFFAVWVRDGVRGEEAFRYFSSVAEFFAEQIERNGAAVSFCRTAGDLEKARRESKRAALLSIEGGGALAGRMEHLHDAQKAGVRMITLTWNGPCEVGDGCMAEKAGGLTAFGRDLVREMNRLGVVVDVSHLSEPGFWDVARLSQKPFVASHSDAKAVCDHRRNLTDDQFREIARGGGLVGINFYTNFLKDADATLDDVLRHIDHFLNLGGQKTVAMGSDFDGCELVDGIGGADGLDPLYRMLADEFGKETADDLFYENAYRFFVSQLG